MLRAMVPPSHVETARSASPAGEELRGSGDPQKIEDPSKRMTRDFGEERMPKSLSIAVVGCSCTSR